MTNLIPILDHGDGRHVDILDCTNGSIIQYNVMESPSNWLVLATKFYKDIVSDFYEVIMKHKDNKEPLPESVYDVHLSRTGMEEFQTLEEVFPDRAKELDDILPSPLVLRTHQKGTWQVERFQSIHQIIKHNDTEALSKHLTENPGDLHCQTNLGTTLLHFAAKHGRVECLRILLSLMTERETRDEIQASLNIRNRLNETPLLSACSSLRKRNPSINECVSLLIQEGSDIHAQQNEGLTALHLAAAAANLPIVQLVLSNGIEVDCRDFPRYGSNTPLHHLCSQRGGYGVPASKTAACARCLLDAGADVMATTEQGSTPLHLVMWGDGNTDQSELIRLLVSRGGDVNAKTSGFMARSVLESGHAVRMYAKLLTELGAVESETTTAPDSKRSRTVSYVMTSESLAHARSKPVLRSANAVMGMTASEAVQNSKK